MSQKITIGVLALQGAFAKHATILQPFGVQTLEVRNPQDLEGCQGLIIPGGESTVISRQILLADLLAPIRDFAEKKPIFGTCAGLILMADRLINETAAVSLLHLMDVSVERNGYGRQSESFTTEIEVELRKKVRFPAIFIRAPRIKLIGQAVKVLATYQNEPVLIEQRNCLAATFHPELTGDGVIHRHFIEKIKKRQSATGSISEDVHA